MTDRSREALMEFLDYLANKGLVAKGTIAARKASASQILGILSDEEASDVTNIELDQVVHRFQNLHGKKYTPQSLVTYKSRVKSALEDFTSYITNPLAFRPSIQPKDRSKQKLGKPTQKETAPPDSPKIESTTKTVHSTIASSNILPIPLRVDLTIFIQGLPFDLTPQEARKIANVVMAMAPLES